MNHLEKNRFMKKRVALSLLSDKLKEFGKKAFVFAQKSGKAVLITGLIAGMLSSSGCGLINNQPETYQVISASGESIDFPNFKARAYHSLRKKFEQFNLNVSEDNSIRGTEFQFTLPNYIQMRFSAATNDFDINNNYFILVSAVKGNDVYFLIRKTIGSYKEDRSEDLHMYPWAGLIVYRNVDSQIIENLMGEDDFVRIMTARELDKHYYPETIAESFFKGYSASVSTPEGNRVSSEMENVAEYLDKEYCNYYVFYDNFLYKKKEKEKKGDGSAEYWNKKYGFTDKYDRLVSGPVGELYLKDEDILLEFDQVKHFNENAILAFSKKQN